MIYFPSCKINLGLHILRKRDDGYHEIESGMLEIPFHDVLEIVPSEAFAFTSSGIGIPGTSNSCVAAWELLKQEFDIPPVRIHLHKMVPMGGGLGGGSSDSAFTLKALNEVFKLNLPEHRLETYAAMLGSDNAFFIKGGLQLSTGRGEILDPLKIDLPKWHVCLVNLGIHVPTKDAYAHVTPNDNRPDLEIILKSPVGRWKDELVNDFETSVFRKHPQLSDVKADLYRAGAVYAAMSGSGSTMFGLFETKPEKMEWRHAPQYEIWI